jgi:anti-sigma factor RsiW
MKKYCDEFEPLIEAIADGTIELSAEQRAHLASCDRCAARLEQARAIEQLLTVRETATPSPSFTQQVMAHVGREKWQTERAIDLGFNLAMAAGVFVIVAGAVGAAWSLGLFSITIDVDAIGEILGAANVSGRFLSQVQTIGMAALLLTMALVLWWWAEAASD